MLHIIRKNNTPPPGSRDFKVEPFSRDTAASFDPLLQLGKERENKKKKHSYNLYGADVRRADW